MEDRRRVGETNIRRGWGRELIARGYLKREWVLATDGVWGLEYRPIGGVQLVYPPGVILEAADLTGFKQGDWLSDRFAELYGYGDLVERCRAMGDGAAQVALCRGVGLSGQIPS